MYNILVVDDEPRVCTGIRNFLLQSDLGLSHVETALNGFEAIDYLRMERFDLVLTDIQMGRMSGLELMETIYMEQPHLPVVVISAHEEFDFAKKSLRLGARDYLVKPVEQEELLRVVRGVLGEKREQGRKSLELSRARAAESGLSRRHELLKELVTERSMSKRDYDALLAEWGGLAGRRFAVLSVRLDLRDGGFSKREITLEDRKLLKYASVNITEESLSEWEGLVFHGFGSELVGIVLLRETDGGDGERRLRSQQHLIGQKIRLHLKQYLNVEATVGMSSLHGDVRLLPKLMEEAKRAAEWRMFHSDHHVLFFEDLQSQENVNLLEWASKVTAFASALKAEAEAESDGDNGDGDAGTDAASADAFVGVAAKRLDAEIVLKPLRELASSEELFNSCFGMLVYRLYGVMLEFGGGSVVVSLQRFDPGAYFGNAPVEEKLTRLETYIREAAALARRLSKERDQSILSRITGYIRGHFRNPALKIQDIASEVHFSTAYLGYLFKREMKQNLWDFVTELRIEEAKRLLATTDKKRYEIAYEVGYESPEHFSRMFKRYAGVSPAEYRKERRGGSD